MKGGFLVDYELNTSNGYFSKRCQTRIPIVAYSLLPNSNTHSHRKPTSESWAPLSSSCTLASLEATLELTVVVVGVSKIVVFNVVMLTQVVFHV